MNEMNEVPPPSFTRRPTTPRAWCRARGIHLVAFVHRRGGWKALALAGSGAILSLEAMRGPGGYEVWPRGESLWFAALLLAIAVRSRRGVIVSRRRFADVLLALETRLSDRPPPPPKISQPRWLCE